MHTQHTRKRHAIATPTSSSSNFSVPPMIAWGLREGGAYSVNEGPWRGAPADSGHYGMRAASHLDVVDDDGAVGVERDVHGVAHVADGQRHRVQYLIARSSCVAIGVAMDSG